MDTDSLFFSAGVVLAIAILSALLVYATDRKDGYSHEFSLTSSLLFASLLLVPSVVSFTLI